MKIDRKVILGLLLGLGVYVAMALWADVSAVTEALSTFDVRWFLAALGLVLGNYLIRFAKWQYYLRLLGVRVPRGESFVVFLASFLLTVTPGKVGEVVKSYLLKLSRDVPMAVTAPIVVAERLTDLLALLCLAALGLASYTYGVMALLVTGGLIVMGLVVLSSERMINGLIAVCGRLPVMGRMVPKMRVAHTSIRQMIAPIPLVVATLLSILGWGLECIAFFLVIGGFAGGQPDLLAATFIFASTTVLGAVSFLPGGLGVTEGSMSLALVELGLFAVESTAVAATYVIRFATLWFAVLIGFFATLVFRRRYIQSKPSDGTPGDSSSNAQVLTGS